MTLCVEQGTIRGVSSIQLQLLHGDLFFITPIKSLVVRYIGLKSVLPILLNLIDRAN